MKKSLLLFFGIIFCLSSAGLLAQERTVTGTVTDGATNEALLGVNIVIQGTTTGVISDANGNYSITVPSDDASIMFSFVGYTVQSVPVGNQTVIDIVLQPSTVGLDELVEINRVKELQSVSVDGDPLLLPTNPFSL
jgi:hypothetical protein